MKISKETLLEWRRLAENTALVSALGEYTPTEFITLLDYIDELEKQIKTMREMLWDEDEY